MTLIDMHDPRRVARKPDQNRILFSAQGYADEIVQHEFRISGVELRLYNEGVRRGSGPYSLITAFVETDKGSVEMVYDEGLRGDKPLQQAAELLVSNIGLAGLILRSIIALRGAGN